MTSWRIQGGDAAIAVWQVHVSQCEFEHLSGIPECDASATTAIMCGSPMPKTLAGMTWHTTGYTQVYST